MANKITVSLGIQADVSQFKQNMTDLQNQLSKLSLGKNFEADSKAIFQRLSNEILNLETVSNKNKVDVVDLKNAESNIRKISTELTQLQQKYDKQPIQYLKADQGAVDAVRNKLSLLEREYNTINNHLIKQNDLLSKSANEINAYNQSITDNNAKIQDNKNLITDQLNLQKTLTDEINKQKESQKTTNAELAKAKDEYEKQLALVETLKDKQRQTNADGSARNWQKDIEGGKEAWEVLKNLKKTYDDLKNTSNFENKGIKNLETQLKQSETTVKNLQKEINDLEKGNVKSNSKINTLNKDLKLAKTEVTRLKQLLDDIDIRAKDAGLALSQNKSVDWSKYNVDPSTITNYQQLEQLFLSLDNTARNNLAKDLPQIKALFDATGTSALIFGQEVDKDKDSIKQLTDKQKDIDRLKQSFLRFFSITNQVQLFKKSLHTAVTTIKELDKVMTETAVVTNYTVSDMWNQLGDYTERANELGVSIKAAYESATIYYQQGLNTNQVMAVSTETLKMARIASLDAAEATDRKLKSYAA